MRPCLSGKSLLRADYYRSLRSAPEAEASPGRDEKALRTACSRSPLPRLRLPSPYPGPVIRGNYPMPYFGKQILLVVASGCCCHVTNCPVAKPRLSVLPRKTSCSACSSSIRFLA